ncbi:Charged multivesicular body protein 7 [Papilio machaon]|uniref:Charged multivesicular body protein 7 n=1 Tax=Papilio machaon TaxID=76193 RepID=A0A194R500_PAPMA|nr:Charged multivesicular body protein 7 [Papilio machaon]
MGLPNTQIPSDKLPECWSDDVRMNALFAPFRIKTANPESWDMKMKFWSEMVRQWCRHRTDPVISAADIKFAFQRKGRTPACIDIVIEEMYRNGELAPISKYLQILHNGPEGWAMWGARIAFKPAVFAVSTVLSLLPNRTQLDSDGLPKASIESTQRFVLESAVKMNKKLMRLKNGYKHRGKQKKVCMDCVNEGMCKKGVNTDMTADRNEQATQFLDNFPPGEQRLGTIDELMKITQWGGDRETLEIILGYLVSQGAAVKKGDVVKLVTIQKRGTQKSCREKERNVTSLTLTGAKNHLRRKHKISTRAQRCDAALENVRHLLHQMREVDSNAAIVDTYRTSSQAMKRTMKEGGLEEDSVFDTMDELKDVLETYNEVEKALGTTVDDIDTAELEQELKELLDTPPPPGGGTPEEKRDKGATISKGIKPSKPWYPPPGDCLRPDTAWSESGVDASLKRLSEGFGELRMDQRLHPGKTLGTVTNVIPVLETYNEVEKALGTTVDDIDTAELEQELKELLDTPPPPGGGTPEEKRDKEGKIPSPPGQHRKESERDFVFDGEERMLAELDKLSLEDTTPKKMDRKPVAVAESAAADNGATISKGIKPSKPWYPPPGDCLRPDTAWSESGVDASLKRLSEGFGELRMDQRLHPGQPLDVDFTTQARHYVTDFQVRDHKQAPAGVWLYNHEDTSAELAASTEYFSTESPGKSGSSFLMAPGEGRRKQEPWHTDEEKTIEDLETRLNRLRGFNM